MATTETAAVDPTLSFSGQVVTDPLGVRLRVTTDAPAPIQEPFLDETYDRLVAQQGNLVFQAIRISHGTLRSYAQRNDYAVEPIAESVELTTAERTPAGITAAWHWPHEAAMYFHFGTSEHVIRGDPLAFEWPAGPHEGTHFYTEVLHPGMPGSNFASAGLEWLRQEVS